MDVRSRFSALQAPTAFFDGPGGTQVPDSVIDASGLAVVWSGAQEQAELYWEQLKGHGLTMAPLEH